MHKTGRNSQPAALRTALANPAVPRPRSLSAQAMAGRQVSSKQPPPASIPSSINALGLRLKVSPQIKSTASAPESAPATAHNSGWSQRFLTPRKGRVSSASSMPRPRDFTRSPR